MEAWNGKRLVYAINVVLGLSIFFFGYDQGLMGSVNSSPDYIATMNIGYSTLVEGILTPTVTEPFLQGLIVAVYYAGTGIGCLLGGYFGDLLGRKKTLYIGALVIFIGAPLQCSAQNRTWFIAARIVNGIGTGHLNAIVPVFSSEVADQYSRGYFLSLEFFLNIFGVVVAYWLGYGLSLVGDGNTQVRWRLPIAFQLVPLILLCLGLLLIPESPRWLASNGKSEEALSVLARLRAEDGKVNEKVQKEFDDIQRSIRQDGSKSHSYFELTFKSCGKLHLSRRTQLAVWLQILQEWTGIACITIFQGLIFELAGFNARKTGLISGINTITYMFSTLVCVYTLDRLGRRVVLFYGAVIQGFTLIMCGVFIHLVKLNPGNSTALGSAAVFMVFGYTAGFGATWLTVPWLYPSELYPVASRAKGNAMGVVGWSIGNFWCTLLVPVMFDTIAENTLYVFGLANVLAIGVVYLFYPETANRTLEDIGYLFSSDSWFAWNAEKEFARLTALDRITDAEKVPVDIEEDLKEGKGTISQTESATESEASISLVA